MFGVGLGRVVGSSPAAVVFLCVFGFRPPCVKNAATPFCNSKKTSALGLEPGPPGNQTECLTMRPTKRLSCVRAIEYGSIKGGEERRHAVL